MYITFIIRAYNAHFNYASHLKFVYDEKRLIIDARIFVLFDTSFLFATSLLLIMMKKNVLFYLIFIYLFSSIS